MTRDGSGTPGRGSDSARLPGGHVPSLLGLEAHPSPEMLWPLRGARASGPEFSGTPTQGPSGTCHGVGGPAPGTKSELSSQEETWGN